jgi:hypothetical protein
LARADIKSGAFATDVYWFVVVVIDIFFSSLLLLLLFVCFLLLELHISMAFEYLFNDSITSNNIYRAKQMPPITKTRMKQQQTPPTIKPTIFGSILDGTTTTTYNSTK